MASKASLFLWWGQDHSGHKPARLGRALHPLSCSTSFDKGLANDWWVLPSSRSRGCERWERVGCGQLSSQETQGKDQGGCCSQAGASAARRHHKHGRCVTCGGKPSGFDLRLLAAQMYSQQPVDCCKMYEISAGKFSNILKLKTVLGPWKTAIYSLREGKIKPPNKKVLKIYLVLPFALHKTQFEYCKYRVCSFLIIPCFCAGRP